MSRGVALHPVARIFPKRTPLAFRRHIRAFFAAWRAFASIRGHIRPFFPISGRGFFVCEGLGVSEKGVLGWCNLRRYTIDKAIGDMVEWMRLGSVLRWEYGPDGNTPPHVGGRCLGA